MNLDDFIYMCSLFACIGAGYFYKDIEDVQKKKIIGTGLGLLIVLIVSGIHFIHPIISTLINSLIILFVDKRKCHIVSFTFFFLYLFFFRTTEYFGIPAPPGHTNMIQMILTLKHVGLAFEINSAYTRQKESEKKGEISNKEDTYLLNINIIEMFHYAFNYIGLLTGPYFSYRTFNDFLTLPFSRLAQSGSATFEKLKWVPFYAVLYLLANHYWPIEYATTSDFDDRSFFYRLWYVWPSFFIFRMRIYIGLTLSECVCTMAGLGAYPTSTNPKPGNGPTEPYREIDSDTLKKEEMNFETIHNINAYGSDFCITFRDGMKHWNMCVQYWLAVNIHKRLAGNKYRVLITMIISTVWHGIYAGYYFCILGAPFYLPIEDIYNKLFRKDSVGLARQIWDKIFWVSKMFAFSYMGIAFLLLHTETILHYYSSVYHFGYILWIGMYIGGRIILQQQKARKRAQLRREEALKSTEPSTSTE